MLCEQKYKQNKTEYAVEIEAKTKFLLFFNQEQVGFTIFKLGINGDCRVTIN